MSSSPLGKVSTPFWLLQDWGQADLFVAVPQIYRALQSLEHICQVSLGVIVTIDYTAGRVLREVSLILL